MGPLAYQFSLSLACILGGWVTFTAWTSQDTTGARLLACVALSSVIWAGGTLSITLAEMPSAEFRWILFAYIGIVAAPINFFLLALEYTGYRQYLTSTTVGGLFAGGAFFLGLAWTNPYHGRYWAEIDYTAAAVPSGVNTTPAPGFWGFVVFTYVLLLASTVLFARYALTAPHLHRSQTIAILIGVGTPWAANIPHALQLIAADYTPMALAVTTGVFWYVTEKWSKLKLRNAFENYVSSAVVEQVAQHPKVLELGGEKKEVTVLFCDIRGFTTLSKELDPQKVVTLLNHFFDQITASVFEHDGTIDKFIGDEVMTIFGAPLEVEDHVSRACESALGMTEALSTLNHEQSLVPGRASEAETPVSVGIGINTGEVVAGNIGSSQRFEYTVVGDAVNLAAQLQELTKRLGAHILVGEATRQAVSSAAFSFRPLGRFRVEEREAPEVLYELVDPTIYREPETLCASFEEGISLYHQRQFSDAEAVFKSCLTIHPDDGPAAYYHRRCKECQADPDQYRSVLEV